MYIHSMGQIRIGMSERSLIIRFMTPDEHNIVAQVAELAKKLIDEPKKVEIFNEWTDCDVDTLLSMKKRAMKSADDLELNLAVQPTFPESVKTFLDVPASIQFQICRSCASDHMLIPDGVSEAVTKKGKHALTAGMTYLTGARFACACVRVCALLSLLAWACVLFVVV